LKEVLDSRFLITHYFSKDEATLSRTRAKLAVLRQRRRGVLPTIVLAEVMNTVCQKAGLDEARSRFRSLEHAGLEFVPLDPSLARDAGFIKCAHRGIPMSDCIIAATAMRLGGAVVSDDPHFYRIKGLRTLWI
jgi:predicted nucleic acid-binding protein